MDGRKLIIDK